MILRIIARVEMIRSSSFYSDVVRKECPQDLLDNNELVNYCES